MQERDSIGRIIKANINDKNSGLNLGNQAPERDQSSASSLSFDSMRKSKN
jgi:hypothetical protein